MKPRKFTSLYLFCGVGAGARGFQEARAEHRGVEGSFEVLAGVDNDPQACADFTSLTGAPAVVADLATMTPAELRAATDNRAPDVIFTSPPCKGFSGLLPKKRAELERYQALNRLVLQGIFLVLETWPDRPPGLIVLENVPRIAQRGAELLRQLRQLLSSYGYVFHESAHDCGELGGLGQHRKRFLMIARHPGRVPTFVYRPKLQRVRSIGEVIGALPPPDDPPLWPDAPPPAPPVADLDPACADPRGW